MIKIEMPMCVPIDTHHAHMLASNNQHPERLKLFCKHTYFDDKDSNTQMHAHRHARTMIVRDIFRTTYQLLFCLNGSERKTKKEKKGSAKRESMCHVCFLDGIEAGIC